MFSKIYLDLDDVLVNFEGGVCQLFNINPLEVGERRKGMWHVDNWGVERLTSESLFEKIDEVGPKFWEYLENHDWFEDLINAAKHYAQEVKILTCPSNFKSSLEGKQTWYNRQGLAEEGIELVIDSCKHNYAGEGILLVDDRETHCKSFVEHGGVSILFPSFGNQHYKLRKRFLLNQYLVKDWFHNAISLLECE